MRHGATVTRSLAHLEEEVWTQSPLPWALTPCTWPYTACSLPP